ncbi:SRPBCC family protein [Nocardia sp. NPDC050793]|uniref:SRPBCC family protein n=1 Tax=Nocardia sp. NPDC050793 TaxID=3155159 RepID=UPI0033D6C708
MATSTVDVVIAAPRDAVYKFFTERDGINAHLPLVQFTLKKPGSPTPEGVGAQYVVGRGGVGIVEETTKLVPGERMEYKIVKGAPVKRHVGIVTFSDADGGTLVSYTMESEPSLPVPAKAVEAGLRVLINQFIKGTQKAFS